MVENSKIKFIIYKDEEILLLNFSQDGNNFEKLLQLIKETYQAFENRNENSILLCSNVSGMRFNMEVLNAFKEIVQEKEPYIKAAAVVGMSKLQKIAYDFLARFTRNMKGFDSEEEAKEWLINF